MHLPNIEVPFEFRSRPVSSTESSSESGPMTSWPSHGMNQEDFTIKAGALESKQQSSPHKTNLQRFSFKLSSLYRTVLYTGVKLLNYSFLNAVRCSP